MRSASTSALPCSFYVDDIGSVQGPTGLRLICSGSSTACGVTASRRFATTNAPKLDELVGERIASRLADGATVITLHSPDRQMAACLAWHPPMRSVPPSRLCSALSSRARPRPR